MSERRIITAGDGMMLTDGVVFAKVLELADWDKPENYRRITEEEYLRITGGNVSDL